MAIAESDLTRNGGLQTRNAAVLTRLPLPANGRPSPIPASRTSDERAVPDASPLASIQEDAERLLKYAAETGRPVDSEIRNCVLRARGVPVAQWSPETGCELLDALTRLTALLHPVTGESLRACADETHTVRGYWKIATLLALVIVPFSVASFVSSALSDSIRKDIATANDLAVKLTAQLQLGTQLDSTDQNLSAASARPDVSVVDVVTELQQFAAMTRSIDGRARQLKAVLTSVFAPDDPFAKARKDPSKLHEIFELPSDVLLHTQKAAIDRIRVYQKVRYFALSGVEDVSLFYGAMATCVLPLLYALLGTCAYLLRSFENQMRTRTFIPSSANSARFLIAGIGGAVVGLFNNFSITQGASIPPLAIAFLVGYAVDVFFSFLEGLLQTFTRPKAAPNLAAAGNAAAGQA